MAPARSAGRRTTATCERPVAMQCATSAEPMNPSAPVITIMLEVSCDKPRLSDDSPAVLAIEAHAALHEPADVLPSLARRASTVVDDAKRRHVRRFADLAQTHAPVVVLEIQEELRIEAAGRVDGLAAHEHANA